MIVKNALILAKVEGVGSYGSDPTPDTANDFIAIHNLKVTPNIKYNPGMATDISLSPRAGSLGEKSITITFDHELQMNPTTEEEPPIEPLLLSCGYSDTGAAGVFIPLTTDFNSCTIWAYLEDTVYKVVGCRGNVVCNFKAGAPALFSFTMQGRYVKAADTTFPTSVTDNGDTPVVCMNQSFVYDSKNPEVESLSFSLNNTIATQLNMDDAVAHGVQEVTITGRDPSGSFNPELVTAATTPDYWTYFEAVTQKTLTYVVANAAADQLAISLPKIELMNITPGDLSGSWIYDIPFKCVRSSGDDEISLTFS